MGFPLLTSILLFVGSLWAIDVDDLIQKVKKPEDKHNVIRGKLANLNSVNGFYQVLE